MTRKKYIKQCMAMGVPRNVAAAGAAHARKHRVPYEIDLAMLKFVRDVIAHRMIAAMERAILYGTGGQEPAGISGGGEV